MSTAARPSPEEHAPYYGRYIALVEGDDPVAALERELDETLALLAGVPADRETFKYGPDKWSVRQVVGHMIDTERVFGYRAMRFARGDATPLPGFAENDFTPASGHHERPLADLAAELADLRRSHVRMFRGLPADAWGRMGVANDQPISVRALAFIMAGHERHHRSILRERYLGDT
jgi:hypothetical protein